MKLTSSVCTLAVLAAASLTTARAATFSWDGGGTDTNWTTAQNWSTDVAPDNNGTAIATLSSSKSTQVNVDANQSLQQLVFGSTTGALTVSGGSITLAGDKPASGADASRGLISYSATTQTISSNLILANGLTVSTSSGKIALNGGINMNSKEIRFFTSSAGSIDVNAAITGNVGGAIAFNGSGITTLNVASTYNGRTTLFSGTLQINTDVYVASGALGNGSSNDTSKVLSMGASTTNLKPTLLIGGAHEFARDVRLGAVDTSNIFTIGGSTADTATFSGNAILGSDNGASRALTLTAATGGRFNVTGNLARATSATGNADIITKTGAGTVVLSGSNNNYLGATNVNVGTLLVNGTLTAGGGTVNVAANATLGGNGSILRAVSLADNATLAAGDNGVGQLTINSLALSGGSILNIDLDGATADSIVVNGDLVLDGILNLSGLGTADTYTLLTYTGTLTDNGLTLASQPAGSHYILDTSTAGQINLVAVPEPAAVGALTLTSLLLLLRKRR